MKLNFESKSLGGKISCGITLFAKLLCSLLCNFLHLNILPKVAKEKVDDLVKICHES